jgi:(2Fe-2S) ferredoxin
MRTHTRHILMCTGPLCTEGGVAAEAMFKRLGDSIDARPNLRVKRTRTHCMVVCKNKGPLVVVYPEGVWYQCKDEVALNRIVTEHLEQGQLVEDLIFHKLGEGDIDDAVLNNGIDGTDINA